MRYLTAGIVFPVSSPAIKQGVIVLDENRTVAAVGEKHSFDIPEGKLEYFKGALCPGFVNTHCHLELSWAKDLIAQQTGLDGFIRQLELQKNNFSEKQVLKITQQAFNQMISTGIIATCDIANTFVSAVLKKTTTHYFHTFIELFGSNPKKAEEIYAGGLELLAHFEQSKSQNTASLTPHSTYSLSENLFQLIADLSVKNNLPLSIHHQENEDENLFFENGSGPIAERRKLFSPHLADFKGFDKRPMQHWAKYISPKTKLLLVHNTVSQQVDIEFIEKNFPNTYWCFCPNANLYIENKLPNITLFRQKNCRITLGTDSLASNRQLSILEEMKTLQKHFPEFSLQELLQWATLNGADFMGITNWAGSLQVGKRPGIVNISPLNNNFELTPESRSKLIINI